ncbi:unnamed protein product [Sphenostylis stenocarpa]|uniref:Uncharacterized protein n=1 Tax=Sphenostylis stenocarpa TaxID=92480 RepID=A0AA86VVD1_9FABA|nr:unnamed protein product [Sphenostylis stenocarpa]
MCTGAESRGIVEGNPVNNSKDGHENGMRSREGGEGTRNCGCGRFLHDLRQQLHNLKELLPTLSLSEVRNNYISSSLCMCGLCSASPSAAMIPLLKEVS